jgi:hypothetical protein
MSRLLMVGCPVDGNVLVSLDDPTVWTDEGADYAPYFVIGPVDFGRSSPAGKLRRVVQRITLGGSQATITITPIADDSLYEDQATEVTLMTSSGTNQAAQADVAVDGRRFQYRVDVTDFDGAVELGEADLAMIPTRTSAR